MFIQYLLLDPFTLPQTGVHVVTSRRRLGRGHWSLFYSMEHPKETEELLPSAVDPSDRDDSSNKSTLLNNEFLFDPHRSEIYYNNSCIPCISFQSGGIVRSFSDDWHQKFPIPNATEPFPR